MAVEAVTERPLAARQDFVANVNPYRRSIVGSPVDGRVEDFLVKAGQAVTARQPLTQLRTRTIEIEIAAAEAELALRRAELTEMRNGLRAEEIELARARAKAAAATNAYAQAKLKRFDRLFQSSSGLSRDEFESARADALAAEAAADEARSALALAEEGNRAEQIEQAAARVDVQEQVVEGFKDRLDKYTIRSPFDGFIVAESTEAGAWVRQGDPVAEVVEIDPIEVEVFVPESKIGFVGPGDAVEVKVESVPDKVFSGTVEHIVPLADSRSRTFPVRVSVENPEVDGRHLLLPGMLARVSLPTSRSQVQMLVPKDALQFGGPSPVVLRVDEGKAQVVPVTTGPSDGAWIAITTVPPGQLKSGDLVITRGNERLRPGQEISYAPPDTP